MALMSAAFYSIAEDRSPYMHADSSSNSSASEPRSIIRPDDVLTTGFISVEL